MSSKHVKFPKTRRDVFFERQSEEKEIIRKCHEKSIHTRHLIEAESLEHLNLDDSWSEAAFLHSGLADSVPDFLHRSRHGLFLAYRYGQQRYKPDVHLENDRTCYSMDTDGLDIEIPSDDEVFLDGSDAESRRSRYGICLSSDVLDSVPDGVHIAVEVVQEKEDVWVPRLPHLHPSHPSSDLSGSKQTEAEPASPKQQKLSTCDDMDHPEKKPSVNKTSSEETVTALTVIFYLGGIACYLWDIGTDCLLAYKYYSHEHKYWFAFTAIFIVLPAVSVTCFSLVLYVRDHRIVGIKTTVQHWIPRAIFLVLQLAPLWRLIETFVHGVRSCCAHSPEKRYHHYRLMVAEDVDSMLLRLFEVFLEAAPQLVLQLYIVTQIGLDQDLVVFQILGLSSSWLSISWSLVGFNRVLRFSHFPAKAHPTWIGVPLQILWRLLEVGSRVLAIVIFASTFKVWVFLAVGMHWTMMLIWIGLQRTEYCTLSLPSGEKKHSCFLEMCFRLMTAFIHIFCFFNLIEGHSRLRALLFYGIMYVENIAMVVIWYTANNNLNTQEWYVNFILIITFFALPLGIVCQLTYYICCHPNNQKSASSTYQYSRIMLCVPWENLSLFTDKQQMYSWHEEGVQNLSHVHAQNGVSTTGNNDSLPPVSQSLLKKKKTKQNPQEVVTAVEVLC